MAGNRKDITHRSVWILAGPIILSNISVPIVGAVDTAVVGHLPGPESIGAVALGALIFSFLYWGFGFLRMGTTGFIARALGAGDRAGLAIIYLRVLSLGLIFGLALVVLGRPIISFALWVIDSSEEVETLAASYATIRIWSAPATLCIYVFTGMMIGLHNARQVFALQLVLNFTNVALDLAFVPWLGFGVAGVAWATLIAEYLAAGLGLYLLRDHLRVALFEPDWREIFSLEPMIEIMRTNSHIFIRTLCLVFSFALFTAQGARLGDLVLAANAILLHLQSIMAYGLDGFAHAAEALTGSAYGARDAGKLRRAVRLTTVWAGICAVVIALLYLLFGTAIISVFSSQEAVINAASEYLPWMIIAPLLSFVSFQLDGVFIGVGHTRQMRNAMVVSTVVYIGLVWLLLPLLGNHGLFLALSLFMILRAITLWYYYPGVLRAVIKEPLNKS